MLEQTLYNRIPHNAPPTPAAFQDATRARELYNYFVPEDQVNAIGKTVSDPVLTSHAQLVAWRLNAQRALISLMDRDTQYFVAEGTKTLQLDDITQSDTPDDATWAACSNVPKTGRICEWTLGALPPPEGGPAYFEVTDLSQDDRFNRLPFIQGPPYFRYYVGVPLVTKKGIAIGSLCALDTEVRQPVTPSMRACKCLKRCLSRSLRLPCSYSSRHYGRQHHDSFRDGQRARRSPASPQHERLPCKLCRP